VNCVFHKSSELKIIFLTLFYSYLIFFIDYLTLKQISTFIKIFIQIIYLKTLIMIIKIIRNLYDNYQVISKYLNSFWANSLALQKTLINWKSTIS